MQSAKRKSDARRNVSTVLYAFSTPQVLHLKRARIKSSCETLRHAHGRFAKPACRQRKLAIASAAGQPAQRRHAPGFVVWGPPASGKSTLCEALSTSHGLVHISAGSLVRAHVLYETEWGVLAAPYVQRRLEVPDSIVIPMVLERLRQVDVKARGFLLDAFPRNVEQDAALKAAGFSYTLAIMLHAPRETLESRLRHRRLDPETDLLYNLRYRAPESQEVLERLVVLDKDRDRNAAELFAMYGRRSTDMFDRLSPRAVRVDVNRELDQVLEDIADVLRAEGVTPLRPGELPQFSRPAEPIEVIGGGNGGSGGNGVPALNGRTPASASAAMRATEEGNGAFGSGGSQKAPISLIRCDGFMCERESVDGSNIAFRGAATEQVMLVWNERPSTVLLLVKKDPALMSCVLDAAKFMMNEKKLNVIVEPRVQNQALANGLYLDTFATPEALLGKVDFVVCLGGDGLILHVSTLFETAVPPVVSFNMGSLGFLTPFQFANFKAEIEHVLNGDCRLSLRMRLSCGIIREGKVEKKFHVLNEVVVDRGASPYLSNLDCFCDGKYITTVQADGIIMSTPTGSTAYSMSAGGSMVHPSVPAILFTPVCPHSLSFRPIVFPDAAKLTIVIAEDARSIAWASFDGKFRQQLKRGDGLLVQMNLYPVPTVNKTDHTGDWFQSLDRAFNFNSRARQKPLPDKHNVMELNLSEQIVLEESSLLSENLVGGEYEQDIEGENAFTSKLRQNNMTA